MPTESTVGIRFNFFQVNYHEGTVTRLPQLLESLQALPLEVRVKDLYQVPRFLSDECVTHSSGNKSFLFTSKRMKAIPHKIKIDGTRESLGLSQGEGLAEDVVMACDRTGSIVSIQQNRYAMSENLISSYLQKFYPENQISFRPVLTTDSLQRFCRASQVRKLRIKLAGVIDFEELKKLGLSVKDATVLQSMMTAPTVDLTWSAYREREGLSDSFISLGKAVKAYFDKGNSDKVLSLETVIRNSVDDKFETESLDLLADRIYSYADIPMNSNKELDRNALLDAACSALVEKRDELKCYISG